MEISNSLSQFQDISLYLEQLEPLERIKTLRSINETYPLKDTDEISEYIKENFTFFESVFDLVLGQFIMVEQILTGRFKFDTETEQDLELMTYVLRPLLESEFDNNDPEKEIQHREKILNTPVQDLYSAVNKFLKNRELVLFTQFAGVFYSVKDEEDEDEEEASAPTAEELFSQQWYWYSIVRSLAKEDIRMYGEIYMLKMNVVLPEMSYLAQRNKIEAADQRQKAALSKL
jgi:hypothetical protein